MTIESRLRRELAVLSRSLPGDAKAYIAAGRAAWKRLETVKRQNFHDWQQVSAALGIGTMLCAGLAGDTTGAKYARLYSVWLRRNGLEGVDAGDRSRLKYYREHASEIDAWRNSLPENKRRRVNHPRTVIRGYRLWKAARQPEPKERG
jgi:hypothetical protein